MTDKYNMKYHNLYSMLYHDSINIHFTSNLLKRLCFIFDVFLCSASSPPRHLFLQSCSFKGENRASKCFTVFVQYLIVLPDHMQSHSASVCSWFGLYLLLFKSSMPHVVDHNGESTHSMSQLPRCPRCLLDL